MNRAKGFLAGLLTVLALVAMLGVWIMLPWFAVLGIAVAIALWLFLTRSGRLAREAAKEVRDVGDEAERASRETENALELRTRDRYRKLIGKHRARRAASRWTSSPSTNSATAISTGSWAPTSSRSPISTRA